MHKENSVAGATQNPKEYHAFRTVSLQVIPDN